MLSILLIAFFISPGLKSQELTVYVFPPSLEQNWKSPRSLTMSSILNKIHPEKFEKHGIGHCFIKLTKNGKSRITGSVQVPGNKTNLKVITEGWGVGVLFAFLKGVLEPTDELTYELAQRYKYGKVSFMRFKISDDMYDRLMNYLTEYIERGYNNIYNGDNQPRLGMGAGCSAFAVSFLEVAGFLEEGWKEKWTEHIRVPEKLIGNPNFDRNVSFFRVLASGRWANENEAYRLNSLYDPWLINKWIIDTRKELSDSDASDIKVVENKKAVGLEYDYRNRKCPDEPAFKHPGQLWYILMI